MYKQMEPVIREQMVQFLVDMGHINKRQHAFMKHEPTASNLLERVRDWLIVLDYSWQTDVIYVIYA
jgi:hypothetical protein